MNKPCVQEARCMRLIPWTLRSGSEQESYMIEACIYEAVFKLRLNWELGQGKLVAVCWKHETDLERRHGPLNVSNPEA